ncbi:VOC family protein [Paraburkholderia oxyphila]|uniref:VOC family protein n=1 Tax=Paraburkholderia oxyphila TaxID=614212 RepID=UPI000489A4A7|nr:VOC family protein [Paraburkholderia oxyphila]
MRLAHTMLKVESLEESLSFYVNILGMRLVRRHDYPQGRFSLALLEDGACGSTARLELMHVWDDAQVRPGETLGHIGFEVENVFEACQAVEARGGTITRRAARMPFGKRVFATVAAPGGYGVALIQRAE